NQFTADTRSFRIEVYQEVSTGHLLYLTETASLAVVPAPVGGTRSTSRPPQWAHALDLKVRKAGEREFTAARKFGIEVYREEDSDHLLYLTELGSLAVVPGRLVEAPKQPKAPKWLHSMDLKVRKAGEADFTTQTKTYGLEVFRDEYSGNLVHISETGGLAVMPPKAAALCPEVKKPIWLTGWALGVRKGAAAPGEVETRTYHLETFRDPTAGVLIHIAETGTLTVVPEKLAGQVDNAPPL